MLRINNFLSMGKCILFTCVLLTTVPNLLFGIVLPEEPEEISASRYSDISNGKITASGEKYDADRLSCAHHSLPFGTVLVVQNQITGRSINVKVNDRISKTSGKIALSESAAYLLDIKPGQTIPVMATPTGMTTASLAPDLSYYASITAKPSFDPSAFADGQAPDESFQQDSIMVAFGAPEADPMHQNSIPVAFISNDPQEQCQPVRAMQAEAIPVALAPTALDQYPPLVLEQQEHRPLAAISSNYTDISIPEPLPTLKPAPTIIIDEPARHRPATMRSNVWQQAQAPIRAQFGAFSDPDLAGRLTNELNAIGFDTYIIQKNRLHCVVTRATFNDQHIATSWVKEVKSIHRRDLAVVRL